MSVFARCLKCNQEFVFHTRFLFKKGLRNGCPCGSKNMKWTGDSWEEVKVDFITNECPKCHRTKVTDILNWEDIKGDVIKKGGIDNKEIFIDSINKGLEETCYCISLGFNWKSPWVIGSGLVVMGLVIGLIIYLMNRKKKKQIRFKKG